MAENKGVALAILGIVGVIAVIGLVLLFKGASGNLSYDVNDFITPSAEKACSSIMCNNGMGAVVLGDELRAEGEFWVCGCSEQFEDQTIADWSNQWKGDEGRKPLAFGSMDNVWLVRKIRTY